MYIFILFSALLLTSSLNAQFSLKNIVSYVVPKTQEEVANYDYPFEQHGTLEIDNTNGDILIKTWNQEKIIVEATKKGTEHDLEDLDIDAKFTEHSASLNTKQSSKNKASVNYTVIVPRTTNIKIKTFNGSITTHQVEGSITAHTSKGAVALNDAANTVRAKTTKGAIDVTMRQTKHAKAIELENQEGDINLALPDTTNAQLAARTMSGQIECDLHVTLKPRTTKINNQFWDSMKREIEGHLGKSGSLISLQTNNGDITMTEY